MVHIRVVATVQVASRVCAVYIHTMQYTGPVRLCKADSRLDKPDADAPKGLHLRLRLIAQPHGPLPSARGPRPGRSMPTNRLALMTPLDMLDADSMDKSPSSFTQNGPVRSMFASRIPQAAFFFSLSPSPTPSQCHSLHVLAARGSPPTIITPPLHIYLHQPHAYFRLPSRFCTQLPLHLSCHQTPSIKERTKSKPRRH